VANNINVTFNTGTQEDTYCAADQRLSYIDPSSGFSCEVTLDIDLKGGAFRYLRSEIISPPTVGLGYAFCDNEGAGAAQLRLIDNPTSCALNPETCVNTCTWIGNNICRANEMPRWGNGACGGQGSQLILNDVASINSVDSFSIDVLLGVLHEGSANMACVSSGGTVQWDIISETCNVVTD
jgi:hypothetical protein